MTMTAASSAGSWSGPLRGPQRQHLQLLVHNVNAEPVALQDTYPGNDQIIDHPNQACGTTPCVADRAAATAAQPSRRAAIAKLCQRVGLSAVVLATGCVTGPAPPARSSSDSTCTTRGEIGDWHYWIPNKTSLVLGHVLPEDRTKMDLRLQFLEVRAQRDKSTSGSRATWLLLHQLVVPETNVPKATLATRDGLIVQASPDFTVPPLPGPWRTVVTETMSPHVLAGQSYQRVTYRMIAENGASSMRIVDTSGLAPALQTASRAHTAAVLCLP